MFTFESLFTRDKSDPQTPQKIREGKAIDEVLSTQSMPSSWDDTLAQVKSTTPAKEKETPPSKQNYIVVKDNTARYRANDDLKNLITWIPTHGGSGLRINVLRNMDRGLIGEWNRMMTELTPIKATQYEFNLTAVSKFGVIGIGMLLLFKEQKKLRSNDIKLTNCNKEMWATLKYAGVETEFSIKGIVDLDF